MSQEFKIKYNGMTLRVRRMDPEETITDKSLFQYGTDLHPDLHVDPRVHCFKPSSAIGDKVKDHPDRMYVEVLSKFYHR